IRTIGVVDRRGDDHTPCGRHDVADVGPTISGPIEVCHVAGVSAVQPLSEERQLLMIRSRRDAAEVETELESLRLDPGCGYRNHRLSITKARARVLLRAFVMKEGRVYFATSCRNTYGRMPPCLNATSSSGVSMRAITPNSIDRPLPSPACRGI